MYFPYLAIAEMTLIHKLYLGQETKWEEFQDKQSQPRVLTTRRYPAASVLQASCQNPGVIGARQEVSLV